MRHSIPEYYLPNPVQGRVIENLSRYPITLLNTHTIVKRDDIKLQPGQKVLLSDGFYYPVGSNNKPATIKQDFGGNLKH